MQRVLVLSNTKTALMPCHPARARGLLRTKRAAVFLRFPFTIILKDRDDGDVQPLELKVDPGSRQTGVTLVAHGKGGAKVVWAAEIEHRGTRIKAALQARRGVRRGRRNRHTRHRPPRFDNRRRSAGWLPPSLQSRVDNIRTWGLRLQRLTPLSTVAVETVRFDTQLMERPDIQGVEYQQGELAGYEVREYLLEKFSRACVYCGKTDVPLQIEHIVAKARGGSNRIANLVLSCIPCNQKKGTLTVEEFLQNSSTRLTRIKDRLRTPLHDAAAVNATRYTIGKALKDIGLPTSFWTGGRTKFNRIRQGLPKTHWLDAACVGETGAAIHLPRGIRPLEIKATGHGDRQMCLVDRHGFPRSRPSGASAVYGFRTGDIVRANVPHGKKAGRHVGRVAVRSTGSFNVTTVMGTVQGINYRYCQKVMGRDGYGYGQGPAFLPALKGRVSGGRIG